MVIAKAPTMAEFSHRWRTVKHDRWKALSFGVNASLSASKAIASELSVPYLVFECPTKPMSSRNACIEAIGS